MKKSIFKRIVSTALALTMLASMAVGMSTSVSAATSTVNGSVSYKLTKVLQRNYNEDTDWMADPDETPIVSDVAFDINKVTNAKQYRVRVIYNNYTKNGYPVYQDWLMPAFSSAKASYYLEGMPFLFVDDFGKGVFDISITPIFANNVEGKSTHIYELYNKEYNNISFMKNAKFYKFYKNKTLVSSDLSSFKNLNSVQVPCMQKAKSYTAVKASSSTVKVTLTDNKLIWSFYGGSIIYGRKPCFGGDVTSYFNHTKPGYAVSFTDVATNKVRCGDTSGSDNNITCTVRRLEPGHTYKVTCQAYVVGSTGQHIYSKETITFEKFFTMPK